MPDARCKNLCTTSGHNVLDTIKWCTQFLTEADPVQLDQRLTPLLRAPQMPAPPTGIRSVHLCAFLLLLTLAPPFLTTNANEQFFFSTLTISSPRHGSAVASPVTPIIIALIPSEPYPSLSAAPLPPNQIELSFDSLSPFSPSSLLSSELLPSLGLTLCFHISGERGFSCADAPLETNPATLGSLFQLQPGEHTVIAFLVDDSVDDSAKVTDKKFPTECSYSTLAAHACPLSLLPPATVTYTTSTFTQLPQEVSKIPYVTSDSTTPLLSKQARTEYFDEVYSAEIWSFPDLDGSVAVKSGFGSTLHQTAQIRPFLDMYFKYNDVRRILDVPCGDMHWMPHVPHLSEGTTCYFGGDVSERVVGENRERFRGNGNFR